MNDMRSRPKHLTDPRPKAESATRPRPTAGVLISLLVGFAAAVITAPALALLTYALRYSAYEGCSGLYCGMGVFMEAGLVGIIGGVLAWVAGFLWFRRA